MVVPPMVEPIVRLPAALASRTPPTAPNRSVLPEPMVRTALAVLVLAMLSYYQVAPYEQAVVLRFGKHVATAGPGPKLKIPLIDQVYKVPTERQLKQEFGFVRWWRTSAACTTRRGTGRRP